MTLTRQECLGLVKNYEAKTEFEVLAVKVLTEIYGSDTPKKVSEVVDLQGAELCKLQINVGKIVRAVGIKK